MGLEDKGAQHHQIPGDVYILATADYTMRTWDYVMRAAANGTTGAFTITLPPVAEARGRKYSFVVRNADAVNTITIEDNNDDSECWLGDIAYNGKCDGNLFYSDGLKWWVLSEASYDGSYYYYYGQGQR
jgi:hypothetical protein